jgi:hypothetical protein
LTERLQNLLWWGSAIAAGLILALVICNLLS